MNEQLPESLIRLAQERRFKDDELEHRRRASYVAACLTWYRMFLGTHHAPEYLQRIRVLSDKWELTWEEVARCCAREDLVWWMTQQLTKGGAR